jgi:hypothetical protein
VTSFQAGCNFMWNQIEIMLISCLTLL